MRDFLLLNGQVLRVGANDLAKTIDRLDKVALIHRDAR